MTAIVDPNLAFQQKMKERIREHIGEFMPDEALAQIVARGVEEAFFTWGESRDRWGDTKKTAPWIVEFLQTECRQQAQKAVNDWIKNNGQKLEEIAKEALENGITGAVLAAFATLWQAPLQQLQQNLSEKFSQLRKTY